MLSRAMLLDCQTFDQLNLCIVHILVCASIFLTQTSASVTLSREMTMTMNEFISNLQHIMIYNTQITYLMWLTRYRGGKLEDHYSSCCLPSGSMYLSYPRDMVVFNCLITFLLYYRIMFVIGAGVSHSSLSSIWYAYCHGLSEFWK